MASVHSSYLQAGIGGAGEPYLKGPVFHLSPRPKAARGLPAPLEGNTLSLGSDHLQGILMLDDKVLDDPHMHGDPPRLLLELDQKLLRDDIRGAGALSYTEGTHVAGKRSADLENSPFTASGRVR